MSKTLAACAADLLRAHAPSTWTACAAADVIDLHRWGRSVRSCPRWG